MALENARSLWSRFLPRRKATGKRVTAPAATLAVGKLAEIEGVAYAFNLDWRFLSSTRRLSKELDTVRLEGYSHYVLAGLDTSVGYWVGQHPVKKSVYSAAAQLAEVASQGGVELFALQLSHDSYALVGLNDSHPVPGFDAVGTLDNLMVWHAEFHAIYSNTHITLYSNFDFVGSEERVNLQDLFAQTERGIQLKQLPNLPRRNGIVAALLVTALAIYGVSSYMTYERERVAAEQQRILQDPNRLYEQAINPALQRVHANGRQVIDAWLSVIAPLPTSVKGWSLSKIVCDASQCEVVWQRSFGSFSDFHQTPPPGMASFEHLQLGDSPSSAVITTRHQIKPFDKPAVFRREDLPGEPEAIQSLSSQLQDTSLLQGALVTLGKPQIFPSAVAGAVSALNKPVLQGSWSLQHELWSLKEFHPAAHAVPSKLELDFSPAGGKTQAASHGKYKITGSYYAKGKAF